MVASIGLTSGNGVSSYADQLGSAKTFTTTHTMQGQSALNNGAYAANVMETNGSFDYGQAGVKTSDISAVSSKVKDQVLSQEDFLKLLTAQLQAQDPTKPADNNELVTQMSQLSMVESLNTINDNMADVIQAVNSSSTVSATSLIGTYVYTDSKDGLFNGGNTLTWAIDAGENMYNNVKIAVKDAVTGEVVYTDTAEVISGEIKFAWPGVYSPDGPVEVPGEGGEGGSEGGDGEVTDPESPELYAGEEGEDGSENTNPGDGDDGGEEKPEVEFCSAGRYILEVTGTDSSGNSTALKVKSLALVTSVTIGKTMEDTMLSLYGHEDMKFSDANRVTL